MKMRKLKAIVCSLVASSIAMGFSHSADAGFLAVLNEFQPNPAGGDPNPQSLELLGTPGGSFTGVFVNVESDPGGANPGDVNSFDAVSGTFDSNGLLLVSVPDNENPSATYILTDSFTGSTSTDIDANDDGTADDLSAFGNILDAIGVPDTTSDESLLYGSQLGGNDFDFNGSEPQLIFRDGESLDWYAVNGAGDNVFDLSANSVNPPSFNINPLVPTFGAINPILPEPSSALLTLFGLCMVGLRARWG